MKISGRNITWSCGVVVITSALHAEGPQFDPGRDHRFLENIINTHFIPKITCFGYINL